jgi:hypothetical protein
MSSTLSETDISREFSDEADPTLITMDGDAGDGDNDTSDGTGGDNDTSDCGGATDGDGGDA